MIVLNIGFWLQWVAFSEFFLHSADWCHFRLIMLNLLNALMLICNVSAAFPTARNGGPGCMLWLRIFLRLWPTQFAWFTSYDIWSWLVLWAVSSFGVRHWKTPSLVDKGLMTLVTIYSLIANHGKGDISSERRSSVSAGSVKQPYSPSSPWKHKSDSPGGCVPCRCGRMWTWSKRPGRNWLEPQ